jgi:hypothetical protein
VVSQGLCQNRYKSIVCDGDGYFTELVRYIHLNRLRVKLVADLRALERYPYSGHGVILGTAGFQRACVALRGYTLIASTRRPCARAAAH